MYVCMYDSPTYIHTYIQVAIDRLDDPDVDEEDKF